MSFSFGSGGTGGSGFSFPTSTSASTGFSIGTTTTSTASGGSSGGFTFGNVVVPQAPTATASPFSFGPPASTATTATSSSFSFTNTPSSSTGGGLLSGTPQTSAASSTFSFTVPTTSAATTTTGSSTGLSAGFSFSNTTPATTTSAAPLSSFSFQPKPLGTAAPDPVKSTAATTSQPTFTFPTKPASGGLLGTPATTVLTATTTSAPTAGLTSLFPPQTAASATTTTTTAAPLGLTTTTAPSSAAPATTTALTTLTTATSTSSGTIGVGAGTGTLSVAGLEEKVNKWVSELREQEERLLRQAAHVNAWDQLLQHGHDQVQQLRSTLNKVKTDQTRLQAELDFIQGQQQELEQLIEPLEAAAAATTPAQHQGDRQRENMHLLAQNLDSQLRQMTDDLCKVIEHLNSNNSGSQASDPVNTVARVLSAHMDTLKWVDQNVALLNQKIDDLSRVSESKRRD